MRLSPAGEIALDARVRIDEVNSHVALDELFIMPDHLHGIILIREDQAAAEKAAPTLGMLVGQFKTHSARRINAARGTRSQPVWQRSYYEHIIRDDEDLARVRTYIANNRWRSGEHQPLGKIAPD
jgi:REP element-mobilizing transposase RayT